MIWPTLRDIDVPPAPELGTLPAHWELVLRGRALYGFLGCGGVCDRLGRVVCYTIVHKVRVKRELCALQCSS